MNTQTEPRDSSGIRLRRRTLPTTSPRLTKPKTVNEGRLGHAYIQTLKFTYTTRRRDGRGIGFIILQRRRV
eukprot:939207-Amorphochlora_amoeboformis.AAC.1